MFLRAFALLPQAGELSAQRKTVLDAHHAAASEHFKAYWPAFNNNDGKTAFQAGLKALGEAYFSVRTLDPVFLANMEKWSKNRDLDIPKEDLKACKALISNLEDSRKKGRAAFESTNKRARL